MATKWLLLVVAASSLGVDCQSTTDDGACSDELVRQWQTDTDRLLDNQQRILEILQQHQTILKHFGKLFIRPHRTIGRCGLLLQTE